MTERRHGDPAAAYEAIAARRLSPADQATLAANGYGGMDKPDADWGVPHTEAARLMATGDPGSPEAIDLARRWMGKVFEATGGDPRSDPEDEGPAREMNEQPTFAAEIMAKPDGAA